MSRYNGGIQAKRKFGSSTITEFVVEDTDTGRRASVRVGGPTPGDRITNAKNAAKVLIEKGIPEGKLYPSTDN